MFAEIKKLTHSKPFQNFIMGVILLASILVGLETSPALTTRYHALFSLLDHTIQTIFSLEIILRILAHGTKPLDFFRSFTNLFDFTITALFYLPFGGAFVSVFRLVRIFRIFRLFTALPKLQLMVGALIKSIPSMGYISVLLLIQFYIFAVIGTVEFRHLDPGHFGSLSQTMLTLFQIVTLDGWVGIYQGLGGGPLSTIYFITFILLGTMIILNLFIGVITAGFEEMKHEISESSEEETEKLSTDLVSLRKQLSLLGRALEKAIVKSKRT